MGNRGRRQATLRGDKRMSPRRTETGKGKASRDKDAEADLTRSPEAKSLLMKVKSGLKTQHSKNEDHGIQSHHFTNTGGKSGNTGIFYFLGLQNHCERWLQP